MADLSYFMRDNKEDEIVEIPGVSGITDENGKVIPYQVRLLSRERISQIYNSCKVKSICTDKNGKPYCNNSNEAIFQVENNTDKALRKLMVEAFVYPDLKDEKLRNHYGVQDNADVPSHVWPTSAEWTEVTKNLLSALGIGSDESDLEKAKNS